MEQGTIRGRVSGTPLGHTAGRSMPVTHLGNPPGVPKWGPDWTPPELRRRILPHAGLVLGTTLSATEDHGAHGSRSMWSSVPRHVFRSYLEGTPK